MLYTTTSLIRRGMETTRKVLADQAFIEKTLDTFAFEPLGETPEQFAMFLKKDRAMAEKKIRDSGVQLD